MPERLNANTVLTGLFASPSNHSLSPIMHNEAFTKLNLNYAYLAFDVNKNSLKTAVESIRVLNIRGVNLSMPNKKEVVKYIDKLSEVSSITRSVNTIVNDNGTLTGHITDGIGYIKSLQEEGVKIKDKNITILGTGGAAISIIAQLALKGVKEINVFKKDRSWESQKQIIDDITKKTDCRINLLCLSDKKVLKETIKKSDVLTNATSVGMKENTSLIKDKDFFAKDLVVTDCIYSPRETKLLKIAKESGCKTINGIGMLMYQGAESFKLWTNIEMPVEYVKNILFEK